MRPIPHGTATGYARGCRCLECVTVMREYRRARRAAGKDKNSAEWANKRRKRVPGAILPRQIGAHGLVGKVHPRPPA